MRKEDIYKKEVVHSSARLRKDNDSISFLQSLRQQEAWAVTMPAGTCQKRVDDTYVAHVDILKLGAHISFVWIKMKLRTGRYVAQAMVLTISQAVAKLGARLPGKPSAFALSSDGFVKNSLKLRCAASDLLTAQMLKFFLGL